MLHNTDMSHFFDRDANANANATFLTVTDNANAKFVPRRLVRPVFCVEALDLWRS